MTQREHPAQSDCFLTSLPDGQSACLEALEPRLLLAGSTIHVADFFPSAEGLTWQYRLQENGRTSNATQTAVAYGQGRTGLRTTVPGENGYDTSIFRIDASGLYQVGWEQQGVDVDWGLYEESEVYQSPPAILPATASIGFSHTIQYDYDGTWELLGQGWTGTWTGSTTETISVVGWETITVPFGTFECVRVDYVGDWSDYEDGGGHSWGHDVGSLWLAEGIGILKETATEKEWEDGVYQGKDTSTRQLTGFSGELPQPDLTASNLSGAAGLYGPGSGITGTAWVSNVGDKGLSDPFYCEARLSTDQVWGNGDDISVYVKRETRGLGKGQGTWHDWSGKVPAGTAGGSYYLGLMVDSTGVVAEKSDANNVVWTAGPNVVIAGAQTGQSDIAAALDLPYGVSVTYSGDTQAVRHRVVHTTGALLGFPAGRDGDFLMLSTGLASEIDTVENTSGSQGTDLGTHGTADDTATVSFVLPVPVTTGSQTLKFDFLFLSEEFPEYVGSPFNDFFTATINGTNIALDQFDNVVNVNNVYFDGALSTAGTFFDGRTAMLTASYRVPDGVTALDVELEIGDVGDGIYDSAVLVDSFRFECGQVVFLNFGGQDVSMGGRSFTMPAFEVTDLGYGAATARQTVIDSVLAEVEADYGNLDVTFTTTRPTSGEYSTVVIGGRDDLVYQGGGTLFGQAQSVDIGNYVKNDVAVVFSGEFGDYYINRAPVPYRTSDPDGVALYLATTTSHELAHNLGLRHVDNAYATDIMKKNSPRQNTSQFLDELMDLPSVEQPYWYDEARQQNDWAYLEGVLGTAAGAGGLSVATNTLEDHAYKWFTLDLGKKTVYDVQLGSFGDPDGDIAPQVFHFDSLTGANQVMVPSYTGADRFFLIGSSKPGGAADVSTGTVATIDGALADWTDPAGGAAESFTLYKVSGAKPTKLTEMGLAASSFADLDWLTKSTGKFTDVDDDTVTVKLSGPGAVAVILDDPDGDGRGAIEEIILANTDPRKSSLTVTVGKAKGAAGPGAGYVDIGKISGPGLRAINAKTANLVGEGIDVRGYLGGLSVYDILNGADVRADGDATQKTTLTAHQIGDGTDIVLGSQLGRLSAAHVGAGSITTPALGSLQVTKDRKAGTDGSFAADLTLAGAGDPRKPTLSSAKIAGAVPGGTWDILGTCGPINIAGPVDGWTLGNAQGDLTEVKSLAVGVAGENAGINVDVRGPMGAVKAQRWDAGTLYAHAIKSFAVTGYRKDVQGDFAGSLTLAGSPAAKMTLGNATVAGDFNGGVFDIAGPAGRITVKGDMNNGQIILTHDPTDRKLGLAGLTVNGRMQGCQVLSTGNLGPITAGGMFDTNVFAGVATGVNGLPDPVGQIYEPNSANPAQRPASIQSVTVRGIRDGKLYVVSFDNSNLAACAIGTVKLCYADLTGTGTEYGVAAWAVKKVTYTDWDKANSFSWPGKRGQMVDPGPQLTVRLPMQDVRSFDPKTERVQKDRLGDGAPDGDITATFLRLLDGWVYLGVETAGPTSITYGAQINLDTQKGQLYNGQWDPGTDYMIQVDLATEQMWIWTGDDDLVNAPGATATLTSFGLLVKMPASAFAGYEYFKLLEAAITGPGDFLVDECPNG